MPTWRIRRRVASSEVVTPSLSEQHDRMPVVLEEVDWPLRLGEAGGDSTALLRPAADTVLRLWL